MNAGRIIVATGRPGEPLEGLDLFRYGGIIADNPWQFKLHSEKGEGKSPQAHYDTMPTDDICALQVGHHAAEHCLLLLWATWPMLPDAFRVLSAWGFRYVTGGAWHKKTKHGKTGFGPGYVLRSACEPYLIGVNGRPEYGSKSERNIIETALDIDGVIEAKTRDHSQKPIDQYELVEALMPAGPHLEIFSRASRPGWDCWGNEAGKFPPEITETEGGSHECR